MVSAACFQPRTAGPKGLARLTSSRCEYAIFKGSGFPVTNWPKATWDSSMAASRASCPVTWIPPPELLRPRREPPRQSKDSVEPPRANHRSIGPDLLPMVRMLCPPDPEERDVHVPRRRTKASGPCREAVMGTGGADGD